MLKDPHEKLPLAAEGDENDPARLRLHKLVRACGRRDRKDRPEIGVVLAQVKSIFDSISKPGGCAGCRGLDVWVLSELSVHNESHDVSLFFAISFVVLGRRPKVGC